MTMQKLRRSYHASICQQVLGYRAGFPNIADGDSEKSVQLAAGIISRLGFQTCPHPPVGQRAGALFESLTREYVHKAFDLLRCLRPGDWVFSVHGDVTIFEQYEHLEPVMHLGLSMIYSVHDAKSLS